MHLDTKVKLQKHLLKRRVCVTKLILKLPYLIYYLILFKKKNNVNR